MTKAAKRFYWISFLGVAGAVGYGLAQRLPIEQTSRQMDTALQVISTAGAQSVTPPAPNPSPPTQQWTPFPAQATFETGDTWVSGGKRYRLYGIQSCIRGTSFTNTAGAKRDCGEAAIAVLASLVREGQARCATTYAVDRFNEVVLCQITIGDSRYDLGTYLTLTGWSYAAVNTRGDPVHMPYSINEMSAKKNQLGLWQFPDVQHPTAVLAAARRQP
jgi:endonuclease YncB( thermonuclease family)